MPTALQRALGLAASLLSWSGRRLWSRPARQWVTGVPFTAERGPAWALKK